MAKVLLTVATVPLDELQCTWSVMSWVWLSSKVPVAVNCCVEPTLADAPTGVTAMETKLALLTVSTVEPESACQVAVIVAEPVCLARATPLLRIFAIRGEDERQLAPVSGVVLPLLKCPIATNCCTVRGATVGFTGETEIDVSETLLTVSVADPEIAPKVAVTVETPLVMLVARPEALT